MFLHIGGDVIVFEKDLIAIMDIEKTTISNTTRDFLKMAEEEGFIMTIGEEMPKSFVVTEVDNRSIVYLSPLSPFTLNKRCKELKKKTGGF
jgi:hypothetical protein